MSTTEDTAVRQLRADARRNRERILKAAAEVFGEQGADAQMDDVARRAGVGVGTVYRHFPNKDVLMGELVTEKFRGFRENAQEALAEEDAWTGFCGLLAATAEHMAQNLALQDALRSTSSAAFEYAEPARRELDEVLDQLVKRAQAQGTLRKDFKAEEVGMLMGGLCASMSGPFPGPRDWRRHLDIILDGLRAQPSTQRERTS
jgi:AcrR family transcriptional regulator